MIGKTSRNSNFDLFRDFPPSFFIFYNFFSIRFFASLQSLYTMYNFCTPLNDYIKKDNVM
ncbi:hypothetical protein BMWSH_0741 [Priestia megaterium WSH-002]|uniref:Uncharacterized protein n=1 Tax=Priestia megaterium (strain WSH-002) TaxID=1006007 RepID=A0A8D3WVC8_PRIMW|nr:hypothetical protein BMWSH_0741 [Priestia megaterium WSH-002]